MNVRVENLSFAYRRGKPILDCLSFEAREGEITAIVGANGAGKTTLVRSILGYLMPRGEVYLGEKNRKDYAFSEVAALVGYLTQESAVQAALTVFDVVLLGRLHRLGLRVDPAELEKVWTASGGEHRPDTGQGAEGADPRRTYRQSGHAERD